MKDFTYKGWELDDAVDALLAYDGGSVDSGIHDDAMKAAVRKHLTSLQEEGRDFDLWALGYISDHYANPVDRIVCGVEDVVGFLRWLDDEMGLNVL